MGQSVCPSIQYLRNDSVQAAIGGRPERECREGLVVGDIRVSQRVSLLDLHCCCCWISFVTHVDLLFANITYILFCGFDGDGRYIQYQ